MIFYLCSSLRLIIALRSLVIGFLVLGWAPSAFSQQRGAVCQDYSTFSAACRSKFSALKAECSEVFNFQDELALLEQKNPSGLNKIAGNYLKSVQLKSKIVLERNRCKASTEVLRHTCQEAIVFSNAAADCYGYRAQQIVLTSVGSAGSLAQKNAYLTEQAVAKKNSKDITALLSEAEAVERSSLEVAGGMLMTAAKAGASLLMIGTQLGFSICDMRRAIDADCSEEDLPETPEPPGPCDGLAGELLLSCSGIIANSGEAASSDNAGFSQPVSGFGSGSSSASGAPQAFTGLGDDFNGLGTSRAGSPSSGQARSGGGASVASGLGGGGASGGVIGASSKGSQQGSGLKTSGGGFFNTGSGGGGLGGFPGKSGGGLGISAYRSNFLKAKLEAAKNDKEKKALIEAFEKGQLLPKKLNRGIASESSRGFGGAAQDSFSLIRGAYFKKRKSLYRQRSK